MEEKTTDKTKEKVEEIIKTITEEGINSGNVDYLGKLVDIHKDLANENYWKIKEEGIKMNYRGNYGRMRDSRGRYMEGGNYGRDNYGRDEYGRDNYGNNYGNNYNGRYSGEEMIDEMYQNYGNYSESRDAYSRGNYGSKQSSIDSLTNMLDSVVDFMAMLKHDAGSKEELDIIKRYGKTLSEM